MPQPEPAERSSSDKSTVRDVRDTSASSLDRPATPTSTVTSLIEHSIPTIPDHELLRHIGEGSFGEVWLARNVMGTFRAVKIVYRKTFDHDRPYEREFKGIQKFEPISRSHEGLVDILQIGRNDQAGYFYYVMELADALEEAGAEVGKWESGKEAANVSSSQSPTGNSPIHPESYTPKTLRSLLHSPAHFPTRSPPHTCRLPVTECLAIGQALASALAYMHANGLIHRDVKPSNIIFVNGVPKLADIGLVADISEARSFAGTIGFIPPEGPGKPQADLYSLGKVLYEMSTGKDRQDFPQLPSDLRELSDADALVEFNEILLKACESEARRRYQSAEEMRADLALLQRGKSVKGQRVLDRRWLIAQRACLVMAVLVAVMVAGWLLLTGFGLSLNRKKVAQHADSLAMTGTRNLEAHELYVKAKVCLRRFTTEGEKLARQYLEEAVKLDPNYVAAYELLFESYGMSWLEEANAGMRATAKKLMELNPDSAPAQWTTAVVKFKVDFEFAEAEKGFRRAVQVDPNNALPHVVYGWYLALMGQTTEAREELQRSANLDPGFPVAEQLLGDSYYVDRSYPQALGYYQKALALAPNFLLGHLRAGRAYEAEGDYIKAIDHFQKFDLIKSESGAKGASEEEIAKIAQKYEALRDAFKQSGARGFWQKRLDQIQYPENSPFEVAAIFAQLEETEKALQWLTKAYEKPDSMNYLLFDHRLDSLHHKRSFQELLKKLGYPESKN